MKTWNPIARVATLTAGVVAASALLGAAVSMAVYPMSLWIASHI